MSYFAYTVQIIYSKYLGSFKQTSQIFVLLLKDKKIKPKSDAHSDLKNHTKKNKYAEKIVMNNNLDNNHFTNSLLFLNFMLPNLNNKLGITTSVVFVKLFEETENN